MFEKLPLSRKIDWQAVCQVGPIATRSILVRTTLGLVSEAGLDGRISRPGAWLADDVGQPVWWSWYSWPGWWHHMNSRSRINWEFKLEAGKEIELPYKWSYFWRF